MIRKLSRIDDDRSVYNSRLVLERKLILALNKYSGLWKIKK